MAGNGADPNARFWPTNKAYVQPVRDQLREAGALTYTDRAADDAEVARQVAAKPRNLFNAERGEPCRVCDSVGMAVNPVTRKRGLCPGCHGAGCGPARSR